MPLATINNGTATTLVDKEPHEDTLLDYTYAAQKIRGLVTEGHTLSNNAQARRQIRYVEVDVEKKRMGGQLAIDDVYIPCRIADVNILREQPNYVSYIRGGRRAAVFKSPENPIFDASLLEADFTKRVRYDDWSNAFYRTIDCMENHGYAVMEVMFDTTKPGHFRNEEVCYEDFLLAKDARDIQNQEILGRCFHFTRSKLESLVKSDNFNADQIEKISIKTEEFPEKSLYDVQKIMFRQEGVIMVAWSCSDMCDDWLREPRPLYLGVDDPATKQPMPETEYPFVLFPYQISEDPVIANLKGRVFKDEYIQEAVTSLTSSTVTAYRRASMPIFTRDDDMPNSNSDIEQINLKPGAVINRKLKTFQMAYPDPTMLGAIQALTTQASQEAGQVNYAANNRQDSRKTATEVASAGDEKALLSVTQIALYSTSVAGVLRMDWRIYSSRVRVGAIPPSVNPEVYGMKFILDPSGDSDVIERQEKISNMQKTWPVVQNTAIANIFLQKLLTLMFPEDAGIYNSQLTDDNTKTQLISGMAQLIKALALDPKTNQLEPAAAPYSDELLQLFSQVAKVTGQPDPMEHPAVVSANKAMPLHQQPNQQPNTGI